MFEDVIKGIREYISDRFMSPLGASLTVSWCIWNYKALLIVFSGESAIRKIHLIHLVYQDTGYSWLHLAAGPLITAAFYILVFPYPSIWVYSYSLRRRKETLEARRRIDGQTPLSHEESRALRKQFEVMDQEHTSETLRLNSRIDTLKEQLKSAVEERDLLQTELRASRVTVIDPTFESDESEMEHIELGKIHWRVLDALGRQGREVAVPFLSKELNLGDSVIWLIVGELEEAGLAYREDMDPLRDLPQRVALTESGVRLFMSNIE